MIEDIVKAFKKDIGPISVHLIETDEEYKQKLINDAKEDLMRQIINSIGLEPEIVTVEIPSMPRDDIPAFTAPEKKKVIKFSLKEKGSR